MPQRQGLKRVFTPDAQGEDSWIEFEEPDLDMMEQVLEEQASKDIQDEKSVRASLDNLKVGRILIARCVVNWNWVDRTGTPLPTPVENPSIVGTLKRHEINAALDAINGKLRGPEKNS